MQPQMKGHQMKTYALVRLFLTISFLYLLFLVTISTECRAQSLEALVIVQQMRGDNTTISEMTLEVDDSYIGGIAAGLGLGAYFNVNMDTKIHPQKTKSQLPSS